MESAKRELELQSNLENVEPEVLELRQSLFRSVRVSLARDITALRHDLSLLAAEVARNAQEVKHAIGPTKPEEPFEVGLSTGTESHPPELNGQQVSIHDRLVILERAIFAEKDKLPKELQNVHSKCSCLQSQVKEVKMLLQQPSSGERNLVDLVTLQHEGMSKVRNLVSQENLIRDTQIDAVNERLDKLERSSQDSISKPSLAATKASRLGIPRMPRSVSEQSLRTASRVASFVENIESKLVEEGHPVGKRTPHPLVAPPRALASPPAQSRSVVNSPSAPVPIIRHASPARPPTESWTPPVAMRVLPSFFDHVEQYQAGAVSTSDIRATLPRTSSPQAGTNSAAELVSSVVKQKGSPLRPAISRESPGATGDGSSTTRLLYGTYRGTYGTYCEHVGIGQLQVK